MRSQNEQLLICPKCGVYWFRQVRQFVRVLPMYEGKNPHLAHEWACCRCGKRVFTTTRAAATPEPRDILRIRRARMGDGTMQLIALQPLTQESFLKRLRVRDQQKE